MLQKNEQKRLQHTCVPTSGRQWKEIHVLPCSQFCLLKRYICTFCTSTSCKTVCHVPDSVPWIKHVEQSRSEVFLEGRYYRWTCLSFILNISHDLFLWCEILCGLQPSYSQTLARRFEKSFCVCRFFLWLEPLFCWSAGKVQRQRNRLNYFIPLLSLYGRWFVTLLLQDVNTVGCLVPWPTSKDYSTQGGWICFSLQCPEEIWENWDENDY